MRDGSWGWQEMKDGSWEQQGMRDGSWGRGCKQQETILVRLGQPLGGVKGWEASRKGGLTCCQLQAGAGAVPPAGTAAS